MGVVLKVSALALTVLCCASAGAAEKTPVCQLRLAASMRVIANPHNLPLIHVSLGGVPANFLMSTAEAKSTIDPALAEQLKKIGTSGDGKKIIHVAGGTYQNGLVFVRDFAFGPLKMRRKDFFVEKSSQADPNIQGMIGGDILHVFDLEYDPAGKRVALFLPSTCAAPPVYWQRKGVYAKVKFHMSGSGEAVSRDWHIHFPAKLDGHDVDVTLDTGAATSAIAMNDAPEVLSASAMAQLPADPGVGNAKLLPAAFKSLSFGGISVSHPHILITQTRVDNKDEASTRPQLILGDDVLNRLHLYISYKKHEIYITPAGSSRGQAELGGSFDGQSAPHK